MISIKEKISTDLSDVITHYEPLFKKLARKITNEESREDCIQELRIKVWKLFDRKDRVFNESYIDKRLKWDVINFINRDIHLKFRHQNILTEDFSEFPCDSLEFVCYNTIEEDLINEDRREFLFDLIDKSKSKMKKRQYEALVLFLSGDKNTNIRRFYGTDKSNLARYYISLAGALGILNILSRNKKIKEF